MAIFTLTFKTSDVLDQIAEDMVIETLPLEESEALSNELHDMKEFARKFVRYDEMLTVEFDMENGTATVRPVTRR